MNKLATIQRISSIVPVDGADKIEQAKVLGWTVVVEKNKYDDNDLVVFCEVDSLLPPDNPAFEFMVKYHHRIKTIKLRGIVSQGLVFPLDIISGYLAPLSRPVDVGEDVTEFLRIKKYEKPIPMGNLHQVKFSAFPFFVPKADEVLIQSELGLLDELRGLPAYMTVKCDGTSMTVVHKGGEFFVCSRNNKIPVEESDKDNLYWPIVKKYELDTKLPALGNIAIQGELVGPKIQSNRLGLENRDWLVFDVYDIDGHHYYSFDEQQALIEKLGLKAVPLVVSNFIFDLSLEKLLEQADGKYNGSYWGYTLNTDNLREGVVIRPMKEIYSSILKGRLSFKVISNKFLLSGGE